MPRGLKVVLIVALAVTVMLCGAMAVGYQWLRGSARELGATGRRATVEGKAWGAGKAKRDCLTEALARSARCTGLVCDVENRLFFGGCVEGAADSPGLCDDVPPRGEVVKTLAWTLGRCEHGDETARQRCSRVHAALQDHCERSRSR